MNNINALSIKRLGAFFFTFPLCIKLPLSTAFSKHQGNRKAKQVPVEVEVGEALLYRKESCVATRLLSLFLR